MKNVAILLIVLAVYGGSLLLKNQQVEKKRSVYIPTTYDLQKKNGIPVTIEEVKKGKFQKFITVTGQVSGYSLKSSIAPFIRHQVRIGAPARLELHDTGKVIWGRVTGMTSSPALLTGLHEMTVTFERKISGSQQFVTVDIPVKEVSNVTLVPREAINNREQKPYVYVFNNNKIEKKYVEISGSNPDVYWIKSGVTANEKVVTSDTRYFSGGEFVKVMNETRKEL